MARTTADNAAPVTPAVLTWARERAGYSIADVARKMQVTEADVRAWEAGTDSPTFKRVDWLAAISSSAPPRCSTWADLRTRSSRPTPTFETHLCAMISFRGSRTSCVAPRSEGPPRSTCTGRWASNPPHSGSSARSRMIPRWRGSAFADASGLTSTGSARGRRIDPVTTRRTGGRTPRRRWVCSSSKRPRARWARRAGFRYSPTRCRSQC